MYVRNKQRIQMNRFTWMILLNATILLRRIDIYFKQKEVYFLFLFIYDQFLTYFSLSILGAQTEFG